MPHIVLVNPVEPLKGKRTMAKKRRTAAQRAATRKMIAANKSRARRSSASSKPKRRRARKSNPVAPLRSSRRRPARRSAPRRSRARRRSNPIGGGIVRELTATLVPSAIGGVGALAVDVAMAALPLPDVVKTGAMRPLARIAAAVAVGAAAGMVTNKRTGHQVMAGALTVVLYDTIKGIAAKFAGGKVPGIGVYDIPGIGMYEVQPAEPMLLPDGSMGYPGSALQTGVEEYIDG